MEAILSEEMEVINPNMVEEIFSKSPVHLKAMIKAAEDTVEFYKAALLVVEAKQSEKIEKGSAERFELNTKCDILESAGIIGY
jgi:hypothetical protein